MPTKPSKTSASFELFSHDADVGVRGRGATEAEAFEQAALALTAAITDPAMVQPLEPVEVRCAAQDREQLLYDWLNALVFEMATRHLLFGRFEVHLDDGRLWGLAWGEPVDVARHRPAAEPKGATYTELAVRRDDDGSVVAQCVVDV